MMKEERVSVSLRLPRGLWKRFKIRCIEVERDAQDVVAELLEEFLKRKKS
jgi:hypothetical protein